MSHKSKQPLKIIPFCLKLLEVVGVVFDNFTSALALAYLVQYSVGRKIFETEIFWENCWNRYDRGGVVGMVWRKWYNSGGYDETVSKKRASDVKRMKTL